MYGRRLRGENDGDGEQGEDSDSSSAHGSLRVRSGYTVQIRKIQGKWQGTGLLRPQYPRRIDPSRPSRRQEGRHGSNDHQQDRRRDERDRVRRSHSI